MKIENQPSKNDDGTVSLQTTFAAVSLSDACMPNDRGTPGESLNLDNILLALAIIIMTMAILFHGQQPRRRRRRSWIFISSAAKSKHRWIRCR